MSFRAYINHDLENAIIDLKYPLSKQRFVQQAVIEKIERCQVGE